MVSRKLTTDNDERMSYTEWMMKIKSVYYGCDVELDKGIARDMQNRLSGSK